MEAVPFKHVQQQRRSARGRPRLLFTNLILDFDSSNAQFIHHQTGDANQSTNSFCEVGSVVDEGRSVRASRCSLETEIMYGVAAIRGTGDHCAANSSFNMKSAWVDPLSNFDMALEYRDSRKILDNWRVSILAQNVDESDSKPNDIEFSGDSNSHKQTKLEEHEEAKLEGLHRVVAARKRKPKILYEEEERLPRKQDRKTRRRRIMRDLGLAAPYGSPFSVNNETRMPM